MMRRDPAVLLLYRTELRMLLRDKRALFIAVVLPLLLFPLMLWFMRETTHDQQRRLQERTFRYAVTGPAAPALREIIRTASRGRGKDGQGSFEEKKLDNPRDALAAGQLELVCTVMAGKADIRLLFRGDREASMLAMQQFIDRLQEVRMHRREALLHQRGISVQLDQVGRVDSEDVAEKRQLTGMTLGRTLTPLLLFLLFSAGALVAVDSLAGEKERGTLETLLTTAAARETIVLAKLLVILTVTLCVTLIQIANFVFYTVWRLIPLPGSVVGAVTPGTVVLLFLFFLPVAALVSAVLLLVSGYAKTYKEAQLFFTPVMLVGVSPGLATLLPDTSLRSLLLVVPVSNIALAVRDLLAGTLSWPLGLLAWVITAGAALGVVRMTARLLVNERLITAVEHDADEPPGPARFPRQVLRWFAVLWAVMIIGGNLLSTPALLPWQLVFNLGVLFLGGSLLMIRQYRLDWREALSIRPVKPIVWPAVLIAAPAGVLVGSGVFRLVNLVMPMPTQSLAELESAMTLHLPFWAQVAVIAVLPGICEEIAFRGLLLHGLRRRLRPVVAAITVGLIFAFFHFMIFRFVPTALLGMLLATVVLLTGSIFPAMLWHALNNALALVAAQYSIPIDSLDPVAYLAAAGVLLVALYVIYRTRERGHPGRA